MSSFRTPADHSAALRSALARSVWQWQLVLACSVGVIATVIAMFVPETYEDPRFVVSLPLILGLTAVALAVPWHHTHRRLALVLPLVDILAIALMDVGSEHPIAFLWMLPIAWIATHFSARVLIFTLVFTATLMIGILCINGLSIDGAINVVVTMVGLGFVAITVAMGAMRNRASKHMLRMQAKRINSALDRVNDQRARNRRVLDSLDVGIARVGSEGVLEAANEAFHTIYSIDEPHLHGSSVVEYRERRGEAIPWSENSINRAARGELFANELVWIFDRDGEWRVITTTTRKIDGSNAADGTLLLVEDVTETLDPPAVHDAAMRTISHELRNPLTAIIGHVDLLLDRSDLSDGARRQMEVVDRASGRLEEIIDRQLASAGPMHEDCDLAYDLARTAAASVEAFGPAAQAEGVTIDLRLDGPLDVMGDAFRMRQVVDNLLSNAIKYTLRGGSVTVRGSRPTPTHVALEFIDTGIGIAADDIPRIFEADFRTDLARQSGRPGTGLGLGISREIVQQQHGELTITSALGQGTTVTLALPSWSEGAPA